MSARFTSGAANCGYCSATCLKPSSASVVFPARRKFTARAKSARAAGGTSGCTAGAAAGAAGVAGAPPAGGAAIAGVPAARAGGPAGAAALTGWAAGSVRGGVELHAAMPANNTTHSAAPRPARHAGRAAAAALSLKVDDHILRHFRLTVTCGLEIGERLEALVHRLVVPPVLGTCRIQLVRLDRLLFEREHL